MTVQERLAQLEASLDRIAKDVFAALDEKVAVETKLATATDLLIEAYDGHAENPQWLANCKTFLNGHLKVTV